jgi:hypothetical protein
LNIFIHCREKFGKLKAELQIDGRTDGQTEGKLIVPFGFAGRGLNNMGQHGYDFVAY